MPTYGPNTVGTGTNDTAIGVAAWGTTSLITADDAQYSTVTLSDFGGGCFSAYTLVNGPVDKYICHIQIGDLVYSNLDLNTVAVKNIFSLRASSYLKIEFNDCILNVTPEHPFKHNNEWVIANDLRVGDVISNKPILSIYHINEEIDVYNLSVDNPNTFMVNNIEVHNK